MHDQSLFGKEKQHVSIANQDQQCCRWRMESSKKKKTTTDEKIRKTKTNYFNNTENDKQNINKVTKQLT